MYPIGSRVVMTGTSIAGKVIQQYPVTNSSLILVTHSQAPHIIPGDECLIENELLSYID